MSAEAQMQLLGEHDGVRWYWAAPGMFHFPGVYYWDGDDNVRVEKAQPAPSPQPTVPVGPKCRDCADFGPICLNSGKPCNSQPQPAVPVVGDEQIDPLVQKHARATWGGSQQDWDVAEFSRLGLVMFANAILALRPAVEPMTEWEIADIFERWDNTSGASMSDFVRMVEAHHGITAKADTVAHDVARYRAIRNGLVYIEPHESGEIYVAGETGVYTKSGDEFDATIDAIAASQQKGGQHG